MSSNTNTPKTEQNRDLAELSIAIVSGLALALTSLFMCVVPLTGQIAGARDFVVYWATGQQLVHHANPYDPEAMNRIERTAGLNSGYGVLYMRNPPWGLLLAFPLGFIGLRTGAFLWSLILLACLAVSVRILWRMHGNPPNRLHWLGLSFAPALLCLIVGQTSLFALLGLVLFLHLYRSRPFLSGVALWLCGLKPHLFLPFGVVFLAWIIISQSYKLLAGAATAMAASFALLYLIDPMAWAQYSQMMRASGIQSEFIPCPSVALRLWIGPKSTWLQYLLPAVGCVWALGYYWSRRQAWDWLKHGSLLMLVSVVSAPYCWLFDQALAIPALLEGAYLTQIRALLVALALSSVLIEVELISGIRLPSPLYLWTAPAWLVWYLFATANKRRPLDETSGNEVIVSQAL